MYTALIGREDLVKLKKNISDLLHKEIELGTNISTPNDFPKAMWKSFGQEGFLGLNISKEYDGLGMDHLAVVCAGEELVKLGLNMGVAMSWMLHLCASHFLIEKHGNKDQKESILPKLASGEFTISFAYGEIGSGGRPINFKTKAKRYNDKYLINGQKDFLTNGPISDVFVVFPLSEQEGIKKLTAFIIFKNTPGLIKLKPIDVRNLKPSPHCSILLDNCSISGEWILGKEGTAYEDIVSAWRGYEETYLMGPFIGGMERQLSLFIACYQEQETNVNISSSLGELYSLLRAIKVLAYEAGYLLNSEQDNISFTSSVVSFGILSHKFQNLFLSTIRESRVDMGYELKYLTGSIENLLGIGNYLLNINKHRLGKSYLYRR